MKDELNVRNIELSIPRPKCNKEFLEIVARLEDNNEITCPNCGFICNTDNFNVSKIIDESIDSLKKTISDINGNIGVEF